MKKKQVAIIIVLAVIFSWVLNIFPGRMIAAKVSTWPLLNRLKILSPQAPIVINNRETVRISDSGDVLSAANSVKSKLSAVLVVSNGQARVSGNAVNLTADGSFVTGAATFASLSGEYFVLLDDGSSAKISQQSKDPATALIFFQADLDSVPVASLSESSNLSSGDKVIYAQKTSQDSLIKTLVAFVAASQADIGQNQFNSDLPRRGFWAPITDPLVSGQAVVNMEGNIVGIWNGSEVISSDVLKRATELFFQNQQKIERPSFGFSYIVVTENEGKLVNSDEGARVTAVFVNSSAAKAGLLPNDLIVSVSGVQINEDDLLEEVLSRHELNDSVSFKIVRNGQSLNLNLVAGELK